VKESPIDIDEDFIAAEGIVEKKIIFVREPSKKESQASSIALLRRFLLSGVSPSTSRV